MPLCHLLQYKIRLFVDRFIFMSCNKVVGVVSLWLFHIFWVFLDVYLQPARVQLHEGDASRQAINHRKRQENNAFSFVLNQCTQKVLQGAVTHLWTAPTDPINLALALRSPGLAWRRKGVASSSIWSSINMVTSVSSHLSVPSIAHRITSHSRVT